TLLSAKGFVFGLYRFGDRNRLGGFNPRKRVFDVEEHHPVVDLIGFNSLDPGRFGRICTVPGIVVRVGRHPTHWYQVPW
ncbi:MAG: hypothetical protein J07HN6_00040, partial [Halonotius sp. J07HN6]